MDQLESDTAELESTTADVHLRQSAFLRVVWTVMAVALPFGVMWYAVASGVPLLHGLIASGLIEACVLPFAILAYRFEVRADRHAIFHREIVTRRIPLEHVERIRVASGTERGGIWPIERTKVEILGNGTRILVGWRSKRMAPLLDFLEQRFPHLLEDTDALPDV
jgi:hypothetical protein